MEVFSNFSITPGCVRKIPLNPPLQKGEEVGIPGLIEKLPKGPSRNGTKKIQIKEKTKEKILDGDDIIQRFDLGVLPGLFTRMDLCAWHPRRAWFYTRR